MRTNTVILFAALALNAGNLAFAANEDNNGLQLGKDTDSICHLNHVYSAGYDPQNDPKARGHAPTAAIASEPAYELLAIKEQQLDRHEAHGDIHGPGMGVSGDATLLNDNGQTQVNQWGIVGIQNIYFNDQCEVADPCTTERQGLCIAAGRQACLSGAILCGPPLTPTNPGGGGRVRVI